MIPQGAFHNHWRLVNFLFKNNRIILDCVNSIFCNNSFPSSVRKRSRKELNIPLHNFAERACWHDHLLSKLLPRYGAITMWKPHVSGLQPLRYDPLNTIQEPTHCSHLERRIFATWSWKCWLDHLTSTLNNHCSVEAAVRIIHLPDT